MKKTFRTTVSLILCLVMLLGMVPFMAHADEAEAVTTRFEKVHSLDEIVPNARYIIVGSYYDELTGETTYHAMGKANNRNNGFRYSYAQDQNGAHNFDISEDTESIVLYSYPGADYDPVLRVRLVPQGQEGRYYFVVDGQGYLCGYTNSTSDGANGHSAHRCMPIANYTKGERWWHMSVPETGENAGEWQIVNRAKLGSSIYCYDMMIFTYPYPHSAGQFQATEAYREDAGAMDEDLHIEHMQERSTNIWIYREICDHKAEEVTHVSPVEATCTNAGVLEYWYCAGCCQYFSDAQMTQPTTLDACMISPNPHFYDEDGTCTVCGTVKTETSFLEFTDDYYTSDLEGMMFLAVGFKDGKAYAMGNNTNPDGSREAVEVTVKPNGVITTDSVTAEFFAFEFDNITFCPDGSYMTTLNGKILVYDKAFLGAEGLPDPIRNGYGYFWRSTENDGDKRVYIIFDPDTLTFRASDTSEDSFVLYKQVCPHSEEAWHHYPETKPTCTEQGVQEYWYCELCGNYYQNGDFETPVGDEYGYVSAENFTAPALGHSYDDQGICEHCSMKRPVYSQISTLAEFDALSKDAYYMIVVKDGDKTYAAALQPANPYWDDWNCDGEYDLFQVDENGNGVPDCIEDVDMDGNGVPDYLEDQNYNEEIGDLDDYYNIYFALAYALDEENMMASNFVEVTMAADGTITVIDEGAMEFQLMISGIWGGGPYYEEDFIYYEIKDTERIRAAWVPNEWVSASGMMGYYGEDHFGVMRRVYGDFEYPGMIDHKNWKISFNNDGTACLVDTWESYDDTAALQFVKYTNEEGEADMTFVGMPEWIWTDSYIMQNVTEILPVYLFVAEPEYDHVCSWGPWEEDVGSDTHTRVCLGCGTTETAPHNWDAGVVTTEPTCTAPGQTTYTCADCGAVKTEEISALGHDWTPWTWENENTHIRSCNHGCGEEERVEHTWTGWTADDEHTHSRSCSVCAGSHTLDHDWDAGVVTKEPTCEDTGLKVYTCNTCGHQKEEVLPVLTYVLGDADGDGDVTGKDLILVRQRMAGWEVSMVESAADANGDGILNGKDLILVRQYLAGWDVVLGPSPDPEPEPEPEPDPEPVLVSSITLSADTQNLSVGNTLSLTANILPANATVQTLSWSVTSGSAYASVSADGVVTAKAVGTATIKAAATDGSGIYATITITVTEWTMWEGNGTQEDPYLIRNVADLVNIQRVLSESGYYFLQTADIDVSWMNAWIVLGTESSPFRHHYDGGNYRISNLHLDNNYPEGDGDAAGGLFTYAENATFRNMNIVNATTDENYTTYPNNTAIYGGNGPATGAIVGQGLNCAFYNCTVSVDFRSSNQWTGGIIGCVILTKEQTVLMENCHASGYVSGSNGTGGLIGVISKSLHNDDWYHYGDPTAVVRNCTSSAEIYVITSSKFDCGIGGLIGSANHVIVENCHATGKVTAKSGYIGGLIGNAEYDCLIACCSAKGDVICTSDDAYGGSFVGGLLGYMLTYTTVHDCYATGDVYAETMGWSDCQDKGSYNGGPWLNYRNPCGALIGCVMVFDDIMVYNNYALGYVYAPDICEDRVYCHGALVGCVYDDYTRRNIIDKSKKDQTDWAGFSEVYIEYFRDNYNLEDLRTYYTPQNYYENYYGLPEQYIMPQHTYVQILTGELLLDQSTFQGWDFENIWIMTEEGPQLRSESDL